MKNLQLLVLLLVNTYLFSQVGIGTLTPNSSAVLDLTSTSNGFLPPRMTNAEKIAISTPPAGLIIYCTNCGNTGEMQFYNGVAWINFSGATAADDTCGAFVAPDVYKIFACFNLGVTDETLDPNVPVQAIHGNYYQWGRSDFVATANTSSGAIFGWNSTAATYGSWIDARKTANDPCPPGFRVPTIEQWYGVINYNIESRTGSWTDSTTNFTSAIHWGPDESTKTLTLPAGGYRHHDDGTLTNCGFSGIYWSSTATNFWTWNLSFDSNYATTGFNDRANGASVRCISD